MTQKAHNNLYGILFMLLNAVSISVLFTIMKELTHYLSSHQVVFFYKFAILILILPWVFRNGTEVLKTPYFKLHLIRGALSISGSLFFMYALQYIDMVDATAVGYVEQVLWAIIGIIYFKERLTKTKLLIIVTSFLGTLLVVQPKLFSLDDNYMPFTNFTEASFNWHYIFLFCSVLCWGVNGAVVKVLGQTTKTKTQLFYVMLLSSIFAYPVAFLKWHVTDCFGISILLPKGIIGWSEIGLQFQHLKYIFLLAVCYFVHAIAFFNALKYAELSTVIPFDYSRLVFTGILGYISFNEIPGTNSYIGYVLIVVAGVALIRAEARKRVNKEHEIIEVEDSLPNV